MQLQCQGASAALSASSDASFLLLACCSTTDFNKTRVAKGRIWTHVARHLNSYSETKAVQAEGLLCIS